MNWILLAVGLAMILKGGSFFVQSAVAIAEKLRVPRVVVGGTLMSLATTTPEIGVSVMSGLSGASGLALGNAAGSVVCNIALIGGTTAILGTVVSRRSEVIIPASMMCLSGVVGVLLAMDLTISRIDCILLLVLGIVYMAGDVVRNLMKRVPREQHPEEPAAGEAAQVMSARRAFALFVTGAVFVVGGSRLLVDAAVKIALQFGIPENIIGVTVVAVGTSLPEFVSAITSARRGVADLAVGNILGANISNMTIVMGSAGVLSPIALTEPGLELNFPPLLAAMALFTWLIVSRGGVSKGWGLGMLLMYAAYILWVVQLVLSGRFA